MKTKIIFLAGFMASGKSTIGPILANTLGWNFFDLDRVIELKQDKKIVDIFAEKGEAGFRKLEREVLQKIVKEENLIIALGGGTIADQKNINFMKKKGKIIFLEASPESFYKRLKFKSDRPMLKGKDENLLSQDELKNRIVEILNYRKKYYDQADVSLQTDGMTIGKTVDAISKIILKDFQ
ncbi:MAG: shikimate kinase [Ignavibacteriaceae bacterium]